jgi:hypothetical protein
MVLAYLDPVAGGMVIQTVIAAAVALPIILRSQLARGIKRIRRQKGEPSATHAEPPVGD